MKQEENGLCIIISPTVEEAIEKFPPLLNGKMVHTFCIALVTNFLLHF